MNTYFVTVGNSDFSTLIVVKADEYYFKSDLCLFLVNDYIIAHFNGSVVLDVKALNC